MPVVLEVLHLLGTVADLGFLKGGFCSAEECKLTSARTESRDKTKKVFNFHWQVSCFPFFLLIISNKIAVIEYLDVTVLLESLDLTALLE